MADGDKVATVDFHIVIEVTEVPSITCDTVIPLNHNKLDFSIRHIPHHSLKVFSLFGGVSGDPVVSIINRGSVIPRAVLVIQVPAAHINLHIHAVGVVHGFGFTWVDCAVNHYYSPFLCMIKEHLYPIIKHYFFLQVVLRNP